MSAGTTQDERCERFEVRSMRTEPNGALRLDADYPRASAEARPAGPPVPWYEAPEFRALAQVRHAFAKGGVPVTLARTTEAGARLAVFWTLYELGHVLADLARCTREGTPVWCAVRVDDRGPGRVILDISTQPITGPSPAAQGAP